MAPERLRAFGDTPEHRALWRLMDRLAAVFWQASRSGIRMPMRRPADLAHNAPLVGVAQPTAGALPDKHRRRRPCAGTGCTATPALRGLLGMLVEDTVHSGLDQAPLINAALGITIRGAGLTRHDGGMHGFWRTVVAHYRALGGDLRVGGEVFRVDGDPGDYRVLSRRQTLNARQVVLAVPAPTMAAIAPGLPLARRLRRYLDRDRQHYGAAVVVFLGVPETEVCGQRLTHHQLLQDYDSPLGDGNNMFVSVSAPGDAVSAPAGHRAVMISTHTALESWADLDEDAYTLRKKEIGERLISYARRVYPTLGDRAVVVDVGTPRTYQRFGFRPNGAVGGPHLTPRNSNQFAIPHDLGGPGAWIVGDSTWPGLGTVACALASRLVAEGVLRERRGKGWHRP